MPEEAAKTFPPLFAEMEHIGPADVAELVRNMRTGPLKQRLKAADKLGYVIHFARNLNYPTLQFALAESNCDIIQELIDFATSSKSLGLVGNALISLGNFREAAEQIEPIAWHYVDHKNDSMRRVSIEVLEKISANRDRLISLGLERMRSKDWGERCSALSLLNSLSPLDKQAISEVHAAFPVFNLRQEMTVMMLMDLLCENGILASEYSQELRKVLRHQSEGWRHRAAICLLCTTEQDDDVTMAIAEFRKNEECLWLAYPNLRNIPANMRRWKSRVPELVDVFEAKLADIRDPERRPSWVTRGADIVIAVTEEMLQNLRSI